MLDEQSVEPVAALRRETHLVERDRPGAKASGPGSGDAEVGIDLLTDETEHCEVLGDSAYGSGEARAVLHEAGHHAMIKPVPLRPAVPGGFTLDDFTVDDAARHRDLPRRADPVGYRPADGDVRRVVSRLPAAGPVYHCPRRAELATA